MLASAPTPAARVAREPGVTSSRVAGACGAAAARAASRGAGPYAPGEAQAVATGIVMALPAAIFCFHSAGPVTWALVPLASTATVTGMSTTSNS